jgi:hypothetical protein
MATLKRLLHAYGGLLWLFCVTIAAARSLSFSCITYSDDLKAGGLL